MIQTRREFMITTATAVAATALGAAPGAGPPQSFPNSRPLLQGDPYLATVDERGLGGRSFDDARAHALRFRSTDHDRDRFVLGLEL